MKDIKQCFSRNIIIVISGLVIIAGIIGLVSGATYLNKSRSDFNKLIINNDNISILNKNLETEIVIKDKRIDEMKSWKEQKSFVMINRNLLEINLKAYSKLSSVNQKIIIDTVLSESAKFNINPIILYSLLHVESSMRFWVEHNSIKVKINEKMISVRAVGLGGVVWEWWGDKLKKAKIAEVRSDLFNPEVNIKAAAFILNEYSKMKMLKGTKSKDESMLRRYFGGNFKSYSERIDKKVMSIVRPNLYRY